MESLRPLPPETPIILKNVPDSRTDSRTQARDPGLDGRKGWILSFEKEYSVRLHGKRDPVVVPHASIVACTLTPQLPRTHFSGTYPSDPFFPYTLKRMVP